MHLSRRDFIGQAAAFAALGAAGRPGPRVGHATTAVTTGAQPRAKETVLFQGDSITDCGRSRDVAAPNRAAALGTGYPLLIASEVLAEQPRRDIAFFNRGISGNRVPDLTARWQADTLDLRPDVLSVLIGVNDLWHKLMGQSSGTVAEYESGYAALLSQASSALPGVRLVVLEPFVLRTGAVTGAWFPEFDERRAAARRVADAARATFVPLQGMFERLSRSAPPEYWAADGVHPTPAGHAEIARLWRQKVRL